MLYKAYTIVSGAKSGITAKTMPPSSHYEDSVSSLHDFNVLRLGDKYESGNVCQESQPDAYPDARDTDTLGEKCRAAAR